MSKFEKFTEKEKRMLAESIWRRQRSLLLVINNLKNMENYWMMFWQTLEIMYLGGLYE